MEYATVISFERTPTKAVLNTVPGLYRLSVKAWGILCARKDWSIIDAEFNVAKTADGNIRNIYSVAVDDPDLVSIVETLGQSASGAHCRLQVYDIPAHITCMYRLPDGMDVVFDGTWYPNTQ